MLVLDGNQKNCRDICRAKDAGWIQYEGLPGHIKTGCTSSPCEDHEVRSAEAESTSDEMVIVSTVVAN